MDVACSGSFLGFKNRTSGTGSCRLLMLHFNDHECSKLGIPSAGSIALCDIFKLICGFDGFNNPGIWEQVSGKSSSLIFACLDCT